MNALRVGTLYMALDLTKHSHQLALALISIDFGCYIRWLDPCRLFESRR